MQPSPSGGSLYDGGQQDAPQLLRQTTRLRDAIKSNAGQQRSLSPHGQRAVAIAGQQSPHAAELRTLGNSVEIELQLVAEKAHEKATSTASVKLAEKEQEVSHWNAVAFFRGGLLGVSFFVNLALAGIIIAYAVGSIGLTPGVLDTTVPAVRFARRQVSCNIYFHVLSFSFLFLSRCLISFFHAPVLVLGVGKPRGPRCRRSWRTDVPEQAGGHGRESAEYERAVGGESEL